MHPFIGHPSRLRLLASLTAAGLLPVGAASLSAQTIDTWNGGTGNWSNGTLWSTGIVPDGTAYDVYIDGGKTSTASVVSLDGNYTFGRLTLDTNDTVNVVNDVQFTVSNGAFSGSGSIVNNGTINFQSASNGDSLRFNGAGTISGTGTINFSGPNGHIFANNAGDRVTIGAGQTITGTADLGEGTTTFTNNGTVVANIYGDGMYLQPGGGTGDFTNAGAGVAQAVNGGFLELVNGGTFSGNSFTAMDRSRVQVESGAIVSNATLATSGTGMVTLDSATLTNATLVGNVSANNAAQPIVNGTLTNNGTFTFNSTSNGVYLHLGGPATLAGTGTVNLIGPDDRIFANNAGDRLTIGAGQTIMGTADLGEGTTTFTNNGTVVANIYGDELGLQPGGGTGDFTNNGTLQAINGALLSFSKANGGTLTNNGVFDVEGRSTLSVPAGALTNLSGTTLTGGTYSVFSDSSNPATLSLGGGNIVTNNATINLGGPQAVFNEINALANNASGGSFTVSGGFNFTTAGALTNAGSILASGSTFTVSGTLTNSGQALTSNGGSIAVQGNTTNSGLIRTQGGTFTVQGTLNSSGVLQTSLGGTGGTISSISALTQTSAGTLLGNGSVTAPTLALAGSLRPGDERSSTSGAISAAVGALTLNGQVGLTGNTTLLFDLAGTTASDRMAVNGALTLDGTLNVNAVAGFGAGRYDLIDYTGALTNNTLDLGTLPSGYNYRIDTGMAGQVDLVVTSAVPEPATWLGGLLSLGLVTLLRRRLRA